MTTGMLQEGRIPLSKAEHEAVDALIESVGADAVASLTRRDPGNTGPVLVHAHDGRVWRVSEAGQVKEGEGE